MSGMCDSNGADILVQYSDSPELDFDDAGHTWVDIRPEVGKLEVSGGDKPTNEFKAFNTTYVNVGAPGAQTILLSTVFKNDTNSFMKFLEETWDGTRDKCYWIRWAYNNAASGSLRYSAKVALLTNPYPGGDANGTVVSKDFNHVTEKVYPDTVP